MTEQNQTLDQLLPKTEAPEISLDNLKSGVISLDQIPEAERERLLDEERESLSDEEKELWDNSGWRTKTFHEKNGEWLNASEFSEKAKHGFSAIKVKELAAKNDALERKLEEMANEIRKLTAVSYSREDRNLVSEESQLQNLIREARDMGDFEAYDRYKESLQRLHQQKQNLNSIKPTVASTAPVGDAETQVFIKSNPWFNDDEVMRNYAIGMDVNLAKQYPNLTLSQRYRMIEDNVRDKFANKFQNMQNIKSPRVEPAIRSGALSNSRPAIQFSDLPERDQKLVVEMVSMGKYKNIAEYMKQHNEFVRNQKK